MNLPLHMGQKFVKNIILYAVLGVLCFVDFGRLWKFSLLFFGLAGFYLWLAYKHWNDEPNIADRLKEKAKGGIISGLTHNRKEKKERKQQYHDFLAQINEEFDMEDYDEDEEEGDEDDE